MTPHSLRQKFLKGDILEPYSADLTPLKSTCFLLNICAPNIGSSRLTGSYQNDNIDTILIPLISIIVIVKTVHGPPNH